VLKEMKSSKFKKKYKAIISDIDGTLIETKNDALPSDKTTLAIRRAVKKGVIFSLATGRPFFMVQYLVEHIGLSSPLITDNGASIVDAKSGKALWEALLSAKETEEILKITRNYPMTRVSCDIDNFKNPSTIPAYAKVRKISIHDLSPSSAEDLVGNLERNFKDLAVVKAAAFEGKEFFDVYVSNASATKQHAVLKLAKILGINTHEIIGIGDHYNDFPLLMACGLKIAMGDSVEDLKVIADYVAPTVEEDGLADVIEKFIL